MPKSNRTNGRQCSRCWSSFVSMAFSTLGLMVAIVTYSVIGGELFRVLEVDQEKTDIENARKQINTTTEELLGNITLKLKKYVKQSSGATPNFTNDYVFNESITAAYQATNDSFTMDILQNNMTTTGVIGLLSDDINDPVKTGSDSRTAYVAPLINLQDSLQEILETDLQKLIHAYQLKVFEKAKNTRWDGKTSSDKDDPIIPAWSFAGSLLYAVSAITTIGYGHVAPKTVAGKVVTIVYCIIGLPLTLMCIAKLGHAFAFAFRVIYHTCFCAVCCLPCVAKQQTGKRSISKRLRVDMNDTLGALVTTTKENMAALGIQEQKSQVIWQLWRRDIKIKFKRSLKHEAAVPTYLCLLVMGAYITAGGALFAKWEKDWSFGNGAYFCFITLTTIGFGDYVPGVAHYGDTAQDDANLNLVLCVLYVLVGLAFIGMCIDLMQVDVVKKVKWFGQKIGLSRPKHAKTRSDKKKERVGMKLSAETTSQSTPVESSVQSGIYRPPLGRSVSNNLEVPHRSVHTNGQSSPTTSTHSRVTQSRSMPSTNMKSSLLPSFRSSGLGRVALAGDEPELTSLESNTNSFNMSKSNTETSTSNHWIDKETDIV